MLNSFQYNEVRFSSRISLRYKVNEIEKSQYLRIHAMRKTDDRWKMSVRVL
jgi:hypothetical protein